MQAGLAGALGTVEVRPLDLVSRVRHDRQRRRPRAGPDDPRDPGPDGQGRLAGARRRQARDVRGGRLPGDRHPQGQHRTRRSTRSGRRSSRSATARGGTRRPAAVKTGTATDARDLSTYGYLAPPANPKAPALAIGVWLGNSDHSMPRSSNPAISLTAAAPLWRSVVRQLTNGQPVDRLPAARTASSVRGSTPGPAARPGPWTRADAHRAVPRRHAAGRQQRHRPARACSTARRAARGSSTRSRPSSGRGRGIRDDANWLARARSGVGVGGAVGSRTAYFWGRSGWGGPLARRVLRPVAEAGPRQRQRQRARAAARPRAAGWPAGPAAGEPAGRHAAAAPATRRAVPSSPSRRLQERAHRGPWWRDRNAELMWCRASVMRHDDGAFLASGCPTATPHPNPSPSGTLVTGRSLSPLGRPESPSSGRPTLSSARLARRSPGTLAPAAVMPM